MANYQLLKADIDKKVYQNGEQEITGANLNAVLNAMVTTLGAEYQFAGVATIGTNPGTPDAKVFYIANGKGTYTNFGGIEVTENEVVVLYWDTVWHKEATGIASQEKLTELGQEVYLLSGYEKTINDAFDIINYYNRRKETQPDGSPSYLESSQFIEIPVGKGYALVTCIGAYYGYIRLSYYNSSKELISTIKYGDEGVTRFFWGEQTIFALGSVVPSSAKYVKAIARTDVVTWSQVMVLFAESSTDVVPRPNYVDYYDRQINVNLLQEKVNTFLNTNVDLSNNFEILNYYDNSKETETADALSTVKIYIPSWATYFLQTAAPKANYGDLGFNFYDSNDNLLSQVRYSTTGITRYLSNDRCGLGFAIPGNSAYIRLYSNRSVVLFQNMGARFYATQDDVEPSTDLVFHEYGIAHLKELDPLDEQLGITKEVIDTNLTKENYYNYQEEQTPSTQQDAESSVKILIPSWAGYVLVGNTNNYSYVKFFCYDNSGNLIAEKRYNGEGVSRYDYWEVTRGYYYYLGCEIPAGTSYIRIGYVSVGKFVFETACVKFYSSQDDIPGHYMTNPYKSFQERNIPALKEYTKTNNWHFGGELPDYYFPYLSNKAAEIESYLKTCASNCDVFFFITDTHFDFDRKGPNELNAGWSFAMMAYLRKYLRIDTILHGGDLLNLSPCGNFMEDYKQVIGTNQVYLALGNHEFISLQDQNVVNYYTRMLSNGMVYGDDNKMWGYVDNPTRKSRYIVLSPFGPSPDGTSPYVMDKLNDDNQYNWFINTALDIPAGYTAIIVSHLLYTLSGYVGSTLTLPTPSVRYVNAIDNYSGAGKIACVLMGHTHSDRLHIGTTGIPYIISQTDRFYTPGGDHDDIGVTRTRGTTTEQHFEVVVINKIAKEIKLFAIGSNSLNGMDDNIGTEVTVRTLSNLTNI